ncbi:MAG: hypothetical protein Kow00107_04020 [Planctomycetota bacterium]
MRSRSSLPFNLRRYPAVGLFIAACAGATIAVANTPSPALSAFSLVLSIVTAVGALTAVLRKRTFNQEDRPATALVIASVFFVFLSFTHRSAEPRRVEFDDTLYETSGFVVDGQSAEFGSTIELSSATIGGVEVGRAFCLVRENASEVLGCNVTMVGKPISGKGTPVLIAVSACVSTADEEVGRMTLLRSAFSGKIAQSFDGTAGPLLQTLLLGRSAELPYNLREPFVLSGNGHLLAVSGLHFGLVVGLILMLLSFLPVSRPFKWAIGLGLCVVLLALVGFTAPSVRATVMVGATAAAAISGNKYNSLNALCFAGFLILCFDPLSLTTPSFQLSFAALAGIILLGVPMAKGLLQLLSWRLQNSRVARYLVNGASISVGAWVFTAPLCAHYFGIANPNAFISALLTIPVLGVVLALGWTTIVLMFLTGGSLGLLPIASLSAKVLIALNAVLSQLPATFVYVTPPSGPLTTAVVLLLVVAGLLVSSGRAKAAALTLALCVIVSLIPSGNASGVYELEGHAQRLVVVSSGSSTVAFDWGARPFPSVRNALAQAGFRSPKLVVRMRRGHGANAPEILNPWNPTKPDDRGYVAGTKFSVDGIKGLCHNPPAVTRRLHWMADETSWEVELETREGVQRRLIE